MGLGVPGSCRCAGGNNNKRNGQGVSAILDAYLENETALKRYLRRSSVHARQPTIWPRMLLLPRNRGISLRRQRRFVQVAETNPGARNGQEQCQTGEWETATVLDHAL